MGGGWNFPAGSTLKDVFMAAGLKNISSERLKLDLLI